MKIVTILALLFLVPSALAQTTTAISGIALKPNGDPAQGIKIRIVKATKAGSIFSVSPASTTTGFDGTFTINAPRGPNAYVWISAALSGFNTPAGTVVAVPDSATAQFQLLQAVTSPPAFLTALVPQLISVKDAGVSVTTSATTLNFGAGFIVNQSPTGQINLTASSGDSTAKFILQVASVSYPNAQALGALGTGLLKSTTTTGVLSIAGASDLPSGIDAAKIGGGAVANAEFAFLDGVTSALQIQIDGKLNTASPVTPGTYESTLATGYLLTGPALDGIYRGSTGNLSVPNSNFGLKTTAPQSALDVNGGVAIGAYAGVNAAPTNSLIVSGNVGIGTPAPNTPLDVAGTITATSFSGAAALSGGTIGGLTSFGVRSTGSGSFDLKFANSENLTAPRTLAIAVNNAARSLTVAGNATISGTNTGDQNVTTINATDGVVPYRSNATTFLDSPLSVAGNVIVGTGALNLSAITRTFGVVPYVKITTPADTGQTVDTEFPGIVFGGDSGNATVTRTGADGTTIGLQREYIFVHPTYAFSGATTITRSSTVAITGAPAVGTNATITNRHLLSLIAPDDTNTTTALYIRSGTSGGGIANAILVDDPSGTIELFKVSYSSVVFIGDSSFNTSGLNLGVGKLLNIGAGQMHIIDNSGTEFRTFNEAKFLPGALGGGGTHRISIISQAAADIPFVIKGSASQTGELQQWHNSSGTKLGGFGAAGNLLLGDVLVGTSGVSVLVIKNGTIPSTSPADAIQLYAEDVSSSSELKVRDEAGNISVLSPHDFSLIGGPSEPMAWSFYSERDGLAINADMLRLIRRVELLTKYVEALTGRKINDHDLVRIREVRH